MPRKGAYRVRFVDELPPASGTNRGVWLERLAPLVEQPNRWAQVYETETPKRANGLVANLTRRRVTIPHPEHGWSFASRGPIIYARYNGPKRRRRG
jgi:hypothetical protein